MRKLFPIIKYTSLKFWTKAIPYIMRRKYSLLCLCQGAGGSDEQTVKDEVLVIWVLKESHSLTKVNKPYINNCCKWTFPWKYRLQKWDLRLVFKGCRNIKRVPGI